MLLVLTNGIADSAPHEDVVSRSPLPTHESDKEPEQLHISNETIQPSQPRSDKGRSSMSREEGPVGIEQEVSQISSSLQSTERAHRQLGQNHRNPFTAGQVRAAIAASEKIRIYSSVAAAILVISSYIQLPVVGSVLIFKPVYLLLLTSISIVLARLILGREGADSRNRQRSSVPSIGGNGAIDQLGKALESGLLLQKVFGALFMDFSIYAVVLICGLSLVRNLGW